MCTSAHLAYTIKSTQLVNSGSKIQYWQPGSQVQTQSPLFTNMGIFDTLAKEEENIDDAYIDNKKQYYSLFDKIYYSDSIHIT